MILTKKNIFHPKIIFILALLFPFSSFANCVLKVRVYDTPPQYMLENNKWVGRAVELIEVLLDEAGCEADYRKMTWNRAILELKKGTIDVLMNVGFNTERAQYFYYINPNSNETKVLLIRKNSNFVINSLDDLKKLPNKIGYEKGNILDKTFTEKLDSDEDFRNNLYPHPSTNLTEMVYLGRLSAVLRMKENARYELNTHPKYSKVMEIHPFHVSSLPTFFAFSKKSTSKEMLLRLQEANIRALASGKYQAIINKWDNSQ